MISSARAPTGPRGPFNYWEGPPGCLSLFLQMRGVLILTHAVCLFLQCELSHHLALAFSGSHRGLKPPVLGQLQLSLDSGSSVLPFCTHDLALLAHSCYSSVWLNNHLVSSFQMQTQAGG